MTVSAIDFCKLKKDFLGYLIKIGDLGLSRHLESTDTFDNFINFIRDKKLEETKIRDYLENENNFFIETLIRFTKEKEILLPLIPTYNLALFEKTLFKKPISPKDYDERICGQSIEFQIDNYYQPSEEWAKRRIATILEFLKPVPGEFILDIGCGVGTFAYHIARMGARSIGIDYSKESLSVARQLTTKFNINEKAKFIVSDATKLPFHGLSFDKIVAPDFIEHINYKNKIACLEEMNRVLKTAGFAIISTPNLFRERLGQIKRRLAWLLCKKTAIETRLHFGLINRFKFEELLRKNNFRFRRSYFDESRPYLAKIPYFRNYLSAHIVWKVWKAG